MSRTGRIAVSRLVLISIVNMILILATHLAMRESASDSTRANPRAESNPHPMPDGSARRSIETPEDLPAFVIVSGVVVDDSGTSLEGARIVARLESSGREGPPLADTWSNERGLFELQVPASIERIEFRATLADHDEACISTAELLDLSGIMLMLRRSGRTIVVRVVDASGIFIGDAAVALLSADRPPARRVEIIGDLYDPSPPIALAPIRESRTQWNGETRFDHLGRGRYRARVMAEGFAVGTTSVIEVTGHSGVVVEMIVLEQQPWIDGVVVDTLGVAIADATISLGAIERGTTSTPLYRHETRSDRLGAFRLPRCDVDEYAIRVEARGHASRLLFARDVPHLRRSGPDGPMRIELRRGRRVVVRLRAADSDIALGGIKVVVTSLEPFIVASAVTDESGTCSLDEFATTAALRARLDHPAYSIVPTTDAVDPMETQYGPSFTVSRDDECEIEAIVRRRGDLHATFSDFSDKRPLAGVVIDVMPSGALAASNTQIVSGMTDADGRVIVRGIVDGPVDCRIRGDEVCFSASDRGTIDRACRRISFRREGNGDLGPMHIYLARSERIEGRVMAADGAPIAGARVGVMPPSIESHHAGAALPLASDVTTDDGRFSFTLTTMTSLTLSIAHADFLLQSIEVDPISDRYVDIVMQRGSETRFRTKDEFGVPATGIDIRVSDSRHDVLWSRPVDADGERSTRSIAPGTIFVSTSCRAGSRYVPGPVVTVTIEPGKDRVIDVPVRSARRLTLSFRDGNDAPLSGARVRLETVDGGGDMEVIGWRDCDDQGELLVTLPLDREWRVASVRATIDGTSSMSSWEIRGSDRVSHADDRTVFRVERP